MKRNNPTKLTWEEENPSSYLFDGKAFNKLRRTIKKIKEERLRRKLKTFRLGRNKCQWKLPVEYAESNGVVAVEGRESKAKRKGK